MGKRVSIIVFFIALFLVFFGVGCAKINSTTKQTTTTDAETTTTETVTTTEKQNIKEAYNITVIQNENGEISPKSVSIARGENKEFFIVPNNGYYVSKLIINDEEITNGDLNVHKFTNVDDDYNISAVFVKSDDSLANYIIKHYFENANGEFILDATKTETLNGKVGEIVKAEPKYEDEGHMVTKCLQKTINKNGSTTIEIYYGTRAYSLKIYDMSGSEEINIFDHDRITYDLDNNVYNLTILHGEEITLKCSLPEHHFLKWFIHDYDLLYFQLAAYNGLHNTAFSYVSNSEEIVLVGGQNITGNQFIYIEGFTSEVLETPIEPLPLSYIISDSADTLTLEEYIVVEDSEIDLGIIYGNSYFSFITDEDNEDISIEVIGLSGASDYYYLHEQGNKYFEFLVELCLENEFTTYKFKGITKEYDSYSSISIGEEKIIFYDSGNKITTRFEHKNAYSSIIDDIQTIFINCNHPN